MNDVEPIPPDAGDEVLAQPRFAASDRRLRLSGLTVVLLGAALAAGVLIGRATAPSPSPAPAPTATQSSSAPAVPSVAPSVALGPASLGATGARCSEQIDDTLVVGIEVRNASTEPAILRALRVGLPLGGLTVLKVGVGSCGQLDAPPTDGFGVSPGASVWLSATLRPHTSCPAPLPVQLRLTVHSPGGPDQTIDVGGFSDLGGVPWRGCRTS